MPLEERSTGASREGTRRRHCFSFTAPYVVIPRRSKALIRCSPRFRWCSSAKTSAHRGLWMSVHRVGVRCSEPPVRESRPRRLESLCPHWVDIPTQSRKALSSPSQGQGAPSAVGQGSSPHRRCVRSRSARGWLSVQTEQHECHGSPWPWVKRVGVSLRAYHAQQSVAIRAHAVDMPPRFVQKFHHSQL